ncbi:hypothetical protein B0I35DRAFT_478101 [Stachybotrys elegans]|uniref:RNA helicase HEL117 n=1 Tax=Stachybotrys elegans TaxID=80388 RepID=A0A8K0SWD6_9HYPO|nr:hypothetical protein B0I35DRAFT_478101 [Stachybotrys elegans]
MDDYASQSRSGRVPRNRSPGSRHRVDDRRSRSPERKRRRTSPARHREVSEEANGRDSSRRHRSHKDSTRSNVPLPFSARPLSKSDLSAFQPLFAEYLDVQKNLNIDEMDDRELKGRWKSFVGKWNRHELAEGWYDPDYFARILSRAPDVSKQSRGDMDRGGTAPERDDSAPENASDDDYGPALPGSDHNRHFGARAPTLQDLSLRGELAEEDREADLVARQAERKLDRAEQRERLEELVPRAEPGTRERKLEKRQMVNEKMRQFRDKSPGMEAGNEKELMGGGDSLDEYKRMKANEQRKKTEREIRREEIERAKRQEIEERKKAYQEREEGTVAMLRELARQRFG